MSNVITQRGDTFEAISRRVYGDERGEALLRSANPGTAEPFDAGVEITAPARPVLSKRPLQSATFAAEDELTVLLDDTHFRFWTSITVTRSIDQMDTLSILAPFDPEDEIFRSIFRPMSFKPATVSIGPNPLFSGTLVASQPNLQSGSRTVSVSCYSIPGVLNDCTAPASAHPLEWNNAQLSTIASALCAPFGISVVFESDEGAAFERVSSRPSQKVLPFLITLAQQRGLLVSSTERGELLFTKANTADSPVVKLREGESPLTTVSPLLAPQQYYSEISAIEPVTIGLSGGQNTVRNPRLRGKVRPLSFETSDTINADVEQAAKAKVGRMFANTIQYTVSVATWRDPQGDVWRPNTILTLIAPGAMVYQEYEFLVRSVSLTKTAAGGETAVLTLAIPEAFDNEIPEALPWD